MKIVAILAVVLVGTGVAAAQKVKVKVENEVVAFDVMPREVNGVTMVPIRSMLDSMGGSMRWDLEKRTISAWKNSRRFDFVVNSRQAVVNDKPVQMDEAPLIKQNRIYVPLKFLADATGYLISLEDGWYVLRPTKG
jgi:hypothetical protein